MSYLLDTNILSELRKPAPRRNAGLVRWLSEVHSDELYLSVLVIAEIRKGTEQVRGADPQQAGALDAWLTQIETFYADRIVPVTTPIAVRWGRAQAKRNYPVIDGLMAATADEHSMQLVSRNIQDLAEWPAVHPHLNPFAA